MDWRRTSGAMVGRAIWKNVVAEGAILEKYSNPDWDDEAEVGGYVHALVTASGTGIATLKFGRYTAALGKGGMWPGPGRGCRTSSRRVMSAT